MKKKIAIIGAGISGLVFANLIKQNTEYVFSIYEKNSSLETKEAYGVQLSINSVDILNKFGFKNVKEENKFNPKKINFYSLLSNKKICDLDLINFNLENTYYTTLKRSLLINFLKEKLFTNSIQFNKKIKNIKSKNYNIDVTFQDGIQESFDYLIIADGVFSTTKSILFNEDIKPKYFGSLAIRALIKNEDLKFMDKNNINLFLGPDVHLVTYPINTKNEINLISVIRKKLNQETLNDESFFSKKENIINLIKESKIQNNEELKNLFRVADDLRCFPTFVSRKILLPKQKNIFFIGDSFYTFPPTFAQGASQSIETAYELYETLNDTNVNRVKKYLTDRVKKIKMVDRRSKLNYFIFHISSPILIIIRNTILKIILKNKNFLSYYLGKIYIKK